MKKLSIHIPFDGFYESHNSYLIDQEIERIFDTDDSGCNHNIPDELYYKQDYRGMCNEYSKLYTEVFSDTFESETGIKINLEYKTLSSPKEYNFTTDRIFAFIPESSVRKLFKVSKENKHEILAKHIKQAFTSRDGFCSFYSNKIETWLEKPVTEWDHNELMTLLTAVMEIKDCDEDTFENYNLMAYAELHGIVDSHIPKEFFEFAEFQRDLKLPVEFSLWEESPRYAAYVAECEDNGKVPLTIEEFAESFPDYQIHIRCDQTIDMKFSK